MSRRVLGAQWHAMSSGARSEFVSLFRSLVEERYYPRWHRIFSRGRLSYLNEKSGGGEVIVKTVLKVGDKSDLLIWRLETDKGSAKVISLAVEDKDLLTKISNRFQKRLGKKGINGLIAWMKEEIEEERAESAADAREEAKGS